MEQLSNPALAAVLEDDGPWQVTMTATHKGKLVDASDTFDTYDEAIKYAANNEEYGWTCSIDRLGK